MPSWRLQDTKCLPPIAIGKFANLLSPRVLACLQRSHIDEWESVYRVYRHSGTILLLNSILAILVMSQAHHRIMFQNFSIKIGLKNGVSQWHSIVSISDKQFHPNTAVPVLLLVHRTVQLFVTLDSEIAQETTGSRIWSTLMYTFFYLLRFTATSWAKSCTQPVPLKGRIHNLFSFFNWKIDEFVNSIVACDLRCTRTYKCRA